MTFKQFIFISVFLIIFTGIILIIFSEIERKKYNDIFNEHITISEFILNGKHYEFRMELYEVEKLKAVKDD